MLIIAQGKETEQEYLFDFLSHYGMLSVLFPFFFHIKLWCELPYRGDSNEYTQHAITLTYRYVVCSHKNPLIEATLMNTHIMPLSI